MTHRQAKTGASSGLPRASRWLASATSLDVRIAVSREELVAAFELVYRCYLEQGYVQPTAGKLFYHPSYGLETSRTIVATRLQRQVVGALTVVGDGLWGLPLESTYPQEVTLLRRRGRQVAEISALAIEKTSEAPRIGIFFALTHFMIHYALWRRYDDLLMSVHPRHQRFYERCFHVRPIGPIRPHHLVCGNPAIAHRIDLHALHEMIRPDVRAAYEAIAILPTRFAQPGAQPADYLHLCQRAGVDAGNARQDALDRTDAA